MVELSTVAETGDSVGMTIETWRKEVTQNRIVGALVEGVHCSPHANKISL